MTKLSTTELKRLGFDKSYYDRTENHFVVRCSFCEATVINGIPCHEHGCPNKTKETISCGGELKGITSIPEDAVIKWGARAIKRPNGYELLGDRQTEEGFDTEDGTNFRKWLKTDMRKALTKWSNSINQSDSSVFKFRNADRGFHCRATCNASYGYIYMTAWKDNKDTNK